MCIRDRVTIAAYADEAVWLKPSGGADTVIHFSESLQYIDFDGLNLDATNLASGRIVKIEGSEAGNPHHIRFQHAELVTGDSDGNVYGIDVGATVAGLIGGNEFIDLRLHGGRSVNPAETIYAVNVSTDDNLIEGCDIFDWTGGGIQIWDGPRNNVVRGNRVHDITRSSDTRVWGIIVNADDTLLYNNLVYRIA